MNDGFYNNPTEVILSQGFSIVGQTFIVKDLYVLAGVSDANGGGGDLDFASVWETKEWFHWAEIGYRGGINPDVTARQNAHVHIWHQDPREEAGTAESWGLAATYSVAVGDAAVPFTRAGYSKGDTAQLRRFVGGRATVSPGSGHQLGSANRHIGAEPNRLGGLLLDSSDSKSEAIATRADDLSARVQPGAGMGGGPPHASDMVLRRDDGYRCGLARTGLGSGRYGLDDPNGQVLDAQALTRRRNASPRYAALSSLG